MTIQTLFMLLLLHAVFVRGVAPAIVIKGMFPFGGFFWWLDARLCPRPPGAVGRLYLKVYRPILISVTSVGAVCALGADFKGRIVLAGVGIPVLVVWVRHRHRGGKFWPLGLIKAWVNSVTLHMEASSAAQSGDLDLAVEIADGLLDSPHLRDSSWAVRTLTAQRASWLGAQGNAQKAIEDLRGAITYYEVHGTRSAAGEANVALGHILVSEGRFDEARFYLERAFEVAGDAMRQGNRAQALCALATAAFESDDLEAAWEYALETRTLVALCDAYLQHLTACDLLALIASDRGELDKASALMDEADGALDRTGHNPHEELLHGIRKAVVLQRLGKKQQALDLYIWSMSRLARLRQGWGARESQTRLVVGLVTLEWESFTFAETLYERGDPAGVTAFAALLELANQTSLSHMLVNGAPSSAGDAVPEISDIIADIASRETATVAPAPAALYARLETLLSRRFRSMFEDDGPKPPQAVPHAVASASHVLQARLLENERGLVIVGIWTSPAGVQQPYTHLADDVQKVMLQDVIGVVRETRDPPGDGQPGSEDGIPQGARGPESEWRGSPGWMRLATTNSSRWAALAELMLPADLLQILYGTDPDQDVPHLLVVPDTRHWSLPWAAMAVAPGTTAPFLADRVVLTLLPSLSLLDSSGPAQGTVPVATRCAAYLAGVDATGMEMERAELESVYGSRFSSLATGEDLLEVLTDPGPRGPLAFLAASVHGDRAPGFGHALILNGRTRLSAARMLSLQFPPLLLINACLSAELDRRRGTDPLGIPTVALCRGARMVIGGIYPLPDGEAVKPEFSHPTALILVRLYALLAKGTPPARALREAQRLWRADHPGAPPLSLGRTHRHWRPRKQLLRVGGRP